MGKVFRPRKENDQTKTKDGRERKHLLSKEEKQMNYGVLLDRAKKEMPYQKPMRETFTPDRQVDWKGLIPIIKELKENKGYPYLQISIWIHKVSGLKLNPQTLRFRCLHFDLTEIKRRNK